MKPRTDINQLSSKYHDALLDVQRTPGFRAWMIGFITFGGKINWFGIAGEMERRNAEAAQALKGKEK